MILGIAECLGLFLLLLAALELGRWVRKRRGESPDHDSGSADGVVFALLGLLIAFTFSAAASRFSERRQLAVQQANALETAWLRTSLLPEPDRESVRRCMRDWVKGYLEMLLLTANLDSAAWKEKLDAEERLQDEVWRNAVAAVDRLTKAQYAALVLTPINDWIALSSTRLEVFHRDLPPFVLFALVVLSLSGATLAGFNLAKRPARSPLHMFLFAGVISFLLYLIIDWNHPRSGLIRADSTDDAMRRLYTTMTATEPPSSK